MAEMSKPAVAKKRDRVLTDDELVKVWRAAEQLGDPSGSALQLLILTGARREEVGRLRWFEIVDGQTICLSGDRTKNGEAHSIPLSAPARSILANVKHIQGSEFVFTFSGKKPIVAWPLAKSRWDQMIAIAPWRIHDLRRTTATGLQKLKTPLQVTEAVLGHVSGSRAGIVGVYQRHDYADEKRAALEAWGAHVIALVEGAPGKVLPMRGKA
jgi:integrase